MGEAIVRVLAREHCRVAYSYHTRSDKAGQLDAELSGGGAVVRSYPLDVLDSKAVSALYQKIERELGAVDVLVNPNTVARVYRDLERDGLLETRRGQGTYISANASALAESERRRLVSENLDAAARDVHAFGLSEKAALDLFREVLANRRPQREEER